MRKGLVLRFLRKIKLHGRDLFWGIFGHFLVNPPFPKKPQSFLFICKGNVCRSPFAEYLARKMVKNGLWKAAEFSSAGLKVSIRNPPPSAAISAARQFGVSLKDHFSTQLTTEMMEKNDIVLVMEGCQFKELRRLYPQFKNKVFLTPLYARNEEKGSGYYDRYNIQDPYGGRTEDFVACFRRINRCIEATLNDSASFK